MGKVTIYIKGGGRGPHTCQQQSHRMKLHCLHCNNSQDFVYSKYTPFVSANVQPLVFMFGYYRDFVSLSLFNVCYRKLPAQNLLLRNVTLCGLVFTTVVARLN